MMTRVQVCRQKGMTLIELMIGVTIGLFMIGAIIALVIGTSRHRQELDKQSRQIENGRYAIELLKEDLRHAGFFGPTDSNLKSELPVSAVPAVCTLTAQNLLLGATIPVYGLKAGDGFPAGCTAPADLDVNSDVLVVRRASTAAPITGAAKVAGTWYVEADPESTDINVPGGVGATLKINGTPALARLRPYLIHIYYIGQNAGVPALKMVELESSGNFGSASTLVDGIERLHVEYGIDTSVKNDGIPDSYVADLSSLLSSPPVAAEIDNLRNVTSLHVHLLARSIDPLSGYQDSRTYTLGSLAGAPTVDTSSMSASERKYRRQVMTATVRVNNLVGGNPYCPNANLCL